MKRIYIMNGLRLMAYGLMIIMLILPVSVYSQDQGEEPATPATPTTPANQPVKNTFEYGIAINNETVEGLSRKSLDFIIQHRFGVIDDSYDLYGLYAPANIRLGLDYGITSRLTVGVGATKSKMQYDLNWKYVLLKQEKPHGMPVTVTYFGNMARSAQDERIFLNQDSVYKQSNRMSYFHELMVARKMGHVSVQAGITYSHYNLVDSAKDQIENHDFWGCALVGRYKFSPQSSIIVDCNFPFEQREFVTTTVKSSGGTISKEVITNIYPRVNLGLGFEVSTGSHQFQIFVCTADAILHQQIAVYNMQYISNKDILIGFNISRQWGL